MGAAERAVEVDVDLDVVRFCSRGRPILGTDKGRIGKEDGEAEGVGNEGWFVVRIGFNVGW